ncbi:MAG: GFA family protein [Proteobacteria bacterium]|nr:GFA family protein [Pseudomonadota bacterium]
MTGFIHLIIPHSDFKLTKGVDNLTTYQFNSRKAKHLFCKNCGIKPFYQPRSHPDSWSANINCLENFNIKEWDIQSFDGQNWQNAIQKLDN